MSVITRATCGGCCWSRGRAARVTLFTSASWSGSAGRWAAAQLVNFGGSSIRQDATAPRTAVPRVAAGLPSRWTASRHAATCGQLDRRAVAHDGVGGAHHLTGLRPRGPAARTGRWCRSGLEWRQRPAWTGRNGHAHGGHASSQATSGMRGPSRLITAAATSVASRRSASALVIGSRRARPAPTGSEAVYVLRVEGHEEHGAEQREDISLWLTSTTRRPTATRAEQPQRRQRPAWRGASRSTWDQQARPAQAGYRGTRASGPSPSRTAGP